MPGPLELHLSSESAGQPPSKTPQCSQPTRSGSALREVWSQREKGCCSNAQLGPSPICLRLCNRSLNSSVYIGTDLVLPSENPSLKEFINWFLPDNTRISGMQINYFLPLTGLSKQSTSSCSFSSPPNKITVLRNTLEKHMGKNKFPSTQMLSTKRPQPPPPKQHYSLQNVFKWKEKEEQLAVVSI